MPEAGLEPAWA